MLGQLKNMFGERDPSKAQKEKDSQQIKEDAENIEAEEATSESIEMKGGVEENKE